MRWSSGKKCRNRYKSWKVYHLWRGLLLSRKIELDWLTIRRLIVPNHLSTILDFIYLFTTPYLLLFFYPPLLYLHGGTPGIQTAILRQYLLIFMQIYIYFQANCSQCKPMTPKMIRPPQTNPPKNNHPKTKYRKILILYLNKF